MKNHAEITQKLRESRADALRPAQEAFLRAFTGSSRTALAEQAFIAGWLAGRRAWNERHISYVCPQCLWTLDVIEKREAA